MKFYTETVIVTVFIFKKIKNSGNLLAIPKLVLPSFLSQFQGIISLYWKFNFSPRSQNLMSKKIITIKDIAKELDISVATVSRALRGSSEIKKETKLAVLQMAKDMDYHPNLLASSLSSKRSKIIGVVVPNINRKFWSNSISGIEKVAYQHDYKVMIFQSAESFKKEMEIVETLANSRVDGILIALSKETDRYEHLQQVIERGIPILLFERVCSDLDASKVVTDDFNGAKELVQHLIDRGRKSIAYISGPFSLGVCQDRFDGYKTALMENGLKLEDDFLIELEDFSYEAAEEAVALLWKKERKPDAIFCFADILAIGALSGAKKLGISVPRELAIAGFGNDDIGRYVSPAITTMNQPSHNMGEMAAEMLLDQIASEEAEHKIDTKIIKPELVVREST